MTKMYTLIVRDRINLGRPHTDADLKRLDRYYEAKIEFGGSLTSADAILDMHRQYFSHFIDCSAEIIPP